MILLTACRGGLWRSLCAYVLCLLAAEVLSQRSESATCRASDGCDPTAAVLLDSPVAMLQTVMHVNETARGQRKAKLEATHRHDDAVQELAVIQKQAKVLEKHREETAAGRKSRQGSEAARKSQEYTSSSMATVLSIALSSSLALIALLFYVRALLRPEATESRASVDDGLVSPASASMLPRRSLSRRHTISEGELGKRHRKKWTEQDALGTMSSKAFIVNMFADLCAPGLLPLAYGMKGIGFIPAGVLLVVFYSLCVYTMWTISRICVFSGKLNFADQWAQEIGPRSAWVPVFTVTLVCFGCCLSYACFYADIFCGVMPALGLPLSRSVCLLIFTLFPTMPLCLLKDLSALAPSSFFALIAVLYTTVVMVVRTADGSYTPGGEFYAEALMPTHHESISDHTMQLGIPSLVLVNNLAMAYLSHYNGCKYYRELEDHTPSSLCKVTATSMGISSIIFAICGFCGYATFGDASDGVILNNYSHNDWPINIGRLGIGLSIVASFPLMCSGLREAILALLKHIDPSKQDTYDLVAFQDLVSLMIVISVTSVAWVLTDAGLVVGVVGAVCGISVIYVIPCVLYAITLKNMDQEKHSAQIGISWCLVLMGAVLAVLGLLTQLNVLG